MRRILVVLLVGVGAVVLGVQGQVLSTHEIVRVLSAQGDVTSSDLQAALGQWQLELYNLPNKTDFFSAQYLVDADANGKFEVGVDPVYAITGQPRLVTATARVFCNRPDQPVEARVHVIADFQVARNGQPQGGTQSGTILFLALGDLRGPWLMTLSLDLNNDGKSEGVLGMATRFALPLIPPKCPDT
ncbi:MAG: hypothetical protein N3E42_00935 [Candidatus Bipolaricaulota bacterium]|nr:hypothetical protein [Candidatus Bipolaricaulota bacterium]